ncbi:MAG: glycerate kinase [Kurthia sp.]|nr:glycerate kinase [Candidatus Kurthia equi]
MKIIISPDAFKGTLTAMEAAKAIERGIKKVDATIETLCLPVADGGEGTMETLVEATGGKTIAVEVVDPLGREITATYGVLGDGVTCIIEMASASGLTLVKRNELNPHIASTFGSGQLIQAALEANYRNFIICLGGSATNDAGIGMLRALGIRLLDENGLAIVPTIDGLYDVSTLDFKNWDYSLNEAHFVIASDVSNPLIGASGATYVYGPQKGVKQHELSFFDGALKIWADVVEKQCGISLHQLKGAGAAGGMGAALLGFLGAEFQQGIQLVLNYLNYREKIQQADLIITGEGQSDEQTLYGKTAMGILQVAKEQGIPCMLMSGHIPAYAKGKLEANFDQVFAIVNEGITKEMAMNEPAKQLTAAVQKYLFL